MRYALALCGVLTLLLYGVVVAAAQPVEQQHQDSRCQYIPPRWWRALGCATATPTPRRTFVPIVRRTATPVPTSTPTATATPTAVLPQPVPEALEMIVRVNQFRIEHGLGALRTDPALMQAAQDYARTLAEQSWWGHDGPDGSNPADRASRAGYDNWEWVGENLVAQVFGSVDSAMDALARSRSHYLNLVQPEWQDVGVGYYRLDGSQYTDYFVQMFACSFGNCVPSGPPVPTPTFVP